MDKKANITTIANLKRGLNKSALFDINNKIQRMKILYEIKQKELSKYDDFANFSDFIKFFEVAKSKAYIYLKIYEKVLDSKVSIDKIKKVGLKRILKDIEGKNS
ncbi:peptide transporter (plasmid) [Borreliella garinii]|uniref:chromosome replication/partitioning protein n=1 Tax=Borreliella garinii TaxID=29519 RepID=UPI000428F7EF|nr:chromosome replication/partitioning protein [Borreliella garinii]APQ15651.1 peptide transporter [Borreliella garinii]